MHHPHHLHEATLVHASNIFAFCLSLLPLCLLESILHTTAIKQQMLHIKSHHAILLLTTFFSICLIQTRKHNCLCYPTSLASTLLFSSTLILGSLAFLVWDSPTS